MCAREENKKNSAKVNAGSEWLHDGFRRSHSTRERRHFSWVEKEALLELRGGHLGELEGSYTSWAVGKYMI